MSLKAKLLTAGISITLISLVTIGVVVWSQNNKMVQEAGEGCTDLARSDLDHIASQLAGMCKAQQELLTQNLRSGLNIAKLE